MSSNPLLQVHFDVPFAALRPEHVTEAIPALLIEARAAIDAIAAHPGPRVYEATLEALDRATEPLEWAMDVVGHLESVATTPELRAAYNAVQPEVAAFEASIPLHAGLWTAVRDLAESPGMQTASPAQQRRCQKALADFRRHGAELSPEDKSRLSAIEVALSKATTTFAQNVLDSTHAFSLQVEDPTDLAGLPASAIAAARQSAAAKGQSGWRFTLQAPSYIPAMTHLRHAGIREALYRAYQTRATAAPHDNRPLVREILRLRAEKAALLGYGNFADLVLEDRMAKSGAAALQFVDGLRAQTQAAFEREQASLIAFRRELEGLDAPAIAPWDVAFYAEAQRKAIYDFDDEILRPYFSADRVLRGMFSLAGRLFGVNVVSNTTLSTWHPTVRAFDLYDASTWLGSFFVDIHPRDTKRDGAWMHGLITGVVESEHRATPHLGLICANVTPPIDDGPALLTHREVETLFHEFGHLLHHCLSRVTVRRLGGTQVAWDFVELPSQILENWCWERDALDLFARHVETDEPIPAPLFERLRRARTFRAASDLMRQLGFAALDLTLHTQSLDENDDPIALALAIAQAHAPAPLFPEYAMIAAFTHLFAHPTGYAAGYYSYPWAEVLDADAFTRFQREGVFSRSAGAAFRREILAKGDTEDAADLYRAFMGRDPSVDPLLIRRGLRPEPAAAP